MIDFEQFSHCDIRVGTVLRARPHPTSRMPAVQLRIDFGSLGIRDSSAQLTARYAPEALEGRQVVAVTNLPPRRVGGFRSEVLVLGAMVTANDVALLAVDGPVPNGTRIA